MNLTNMTMVCSCHYYCHDLSMALVDCQVEDFSYYLYHICQEEYVILNDTNFDRGERNIYCDCVDDIRGRGDIKSQSL